MTAATVDPGPARVRVRAGVARVARAAPGWTVRAVGAGWSLGAQLGGAAAALAGLHMLAGTAVTLVVGGLALLSIGTLAEMAGQPNRKSGV